MIASDFEKEIFAITNRAVEENEISLAQLLGITFAVHETVKAIFDYRVYQEVKTVKPNLPDNVTQMR